jgi:hypothetical protein
MSTEIIPKGYLPTNQPDLFFEDNAVGRMKKEVWEASDEEIDAILAEYSVPSPVEWGKPGSYIQTTTRWKVEENRKKNDIVFIPVGCTESTFPAPRTHCMSARFAREFVASRPNTVHRSTWRCLR